MKQNTETFSKYTIAAVFLTSVSMANFVTSKTKMNTIATLALKLSLERSMALKVSDESATVSGMLLATARVANQAEALIELFQQVSPKYYIGSAPISVGSAEGSAKSTEGSVMTTEGSAEAIEGSVKTTEGSAMATEGSVEATEGPAETAEGSVKTTDVLIGTMPASIGTGKPLVGTVLKSAELVTRANVLDSPYLEITRPLDNEQDQALTPVKWSSIAHTAFIVSIAGHLFVLSPLPYLS